MKKICINCQKELLIVCFSIIKKTEKTYNNKCKNCVNYENDKNVNDILNFKKYEEAFKIFQEKSRILEIKTQRCKLKSSIKNTNELERKKAKIKYGTLYSTKRKITDPLYKLTCSIRSNISQSIRKQGYTKKSKTYEILGCSFEYFKNHLQEKFTDGMCWENYGQWHLDHIYPVSLAKDEKHLIKLNHYTNFQPLWAEENWRKSNKIF